MTPLSDDARKQLEIKEQVIKKIEDKKEEYLEMISKFEEALEFYSVLIKVIHENKTRFKKYEDAQLQFNATVKSYSTQRKNLKKAVAKFNNLIKDKHKYSPEQLLEELKM